jgi:hypothetical protein
MTEPSTRLDIALQFIFSEEAACTVSTAFSS